MMVSDTLFFGMVITWALVFGANGVGAATSADEEYPVEKRIVQRSLVSMGVTARLEHVLAKARRGERVVVGVIGGSITAGAHASTEPNRWGNRVAQWWRETFPDTEIAFVNAGIGATGSDIGAHRAQAHLLVHHPDFVVAEYAVNDGGSPLAAETLEGLVRQILGQPNRPAVMLLFTMNNQGTNVQDAHISIGNHYGLPMVSFRDALWPEVEAGRIAWDDIEADEVHPNDRGHAYCATFVTSVLETVFERLPADADLADIPPVPAPKISDVFEYASLFNADTLSPSRNTGWEPYEDPVFAGLFGKGWRATTPGSVLEFEVAAPVISVMFYRIKGAMGIAEAQVDEGEPVTMDAWFDADWGGYTPFQLVARDLGPGRHTLRIRVLDERNEHSDGHEFRVYAIMAAGLPVP